MVKKDFDNDFDRLTEKFLTENKIEIEDDGFTQRVMQNLPARTDQQHRLSIAWNCICLSLLVIFFWQTDILPNLWIDTKVFFQTLPLNIQDVSIW